ncbi:MAG: methyltransferase [Deltaproteobacteria bacterium HGW-Deltaproteobacteria-14]|nr:MAG: methyltransferase [Deltaproteobacteria bacterium HGW-Deltaproteobacteria-14]
MSNTTLAPLDVEGAVSARYSEAARAREESLCCPIQYDAALLAAIPPEVLERDYGCGDPSAHLRRGETVLDLGSGAGKICFIASQVVGPEGRVIGVDVNEEMLALARRSAPLFAEGVGFGNVEFRRGRIQDLGLDLDLLDGWLREHPVRSSDHLAQLDGAMARLRHEAPLVAADSVDVVVSNCVLNLVRSEDKRRLFEEIRRVLRRGGRAVISDIVSDEDVPEHLQRDPELWSGCISGALREDRFLEAFEQAGFYGIEVLVRDETPWRTVAGIEFRSVTVVAYKGKEGPCVDRKHAVIYRGPFREVTDDDGHVLRRGARMAVCEKTFGIYAREPYRGHVDLVAPHVLPTLAESRAFPCDASDMLRDPRETKGVDYRVTSEAAPTCSTGTASDAGCC